MPRKAINKSVSNEELDVLNNLCQWFNALEVEKQTSILEYVLEKTNDLNLENEDTIVFNKLIDNIVKIIAEENGNMEKVIQILSSHGLEKVFANGFFKFCKEFAQPYFDARIVALMTKKHIANLCSFVLNHMFLYADYTEIPLEQFLNDIGFNESETESAKSALSFIRHQYYNVCNRTCHPDTMKGDLLNKFLIPNDLVSIIVDPLLENLKELQQAHLLNQVNKIIEKIEALDSNDKDKA